MRITLYTDGSGTGPAPSLTNNFAELMAVEMGLLVIRSQGITVEVVTDSKNVIGWLFGFDTKNNAPDPAKRFERRNPAIAEAVQRIEVLAATKQLTLAFRCLKGHGGHPENERCDKLAGHLALLMWSIV